MLNYKSAESCVFDAISLGEIMLRLDPGAGRIHTTRRFDVWEGGGEYNVVRGLRRCFGLRSAVVTARQQGIKAGLIRPITVWPFPTDASQKAAEHAKAFLSVEMSMGQMVDDVRLALNGARPTYFYGRTGGMIPSPDEVLAAIRQMQGGNA